MWKPDGAHTSDYNEIELSSKLVSRLMVADGSLFYVLRFASVYHFDYKANDRTDAGNSTQYGDDYRRSEFHVIRPPFLDPGGLNYTTLPVAFANPRGSVCLPPSAEQNWQTLAWAVAST